MQNEAPPYVRDGASVVGVNQQRARMARVVNLKNGNWFHENVLWSGDLRLFKNEIQETLAVAAQTTPCHVPPSAGAFLPLD
jgi:hypothetical protein